MQLKQFVCVYAVSATGQSVLCCFFFYGLFYDAISISDFIYVELFYVVRLLMRIRKDLKKKGGGGASCIPGAVLSFAWRDRGRSRKSAIGMDGTTAILAFFPSKCIEQGWPAT